MKKSIIERFLLWIMPLSPIETLLMLLLNGQRPFANDSYSRNKIGYVKSILHKEPSIITKQFPECYMMIRDRELLERYSYYTWYTKRKKRFIISMAIIRIFNAHFKSLNKHEYETYQFEKNFDLPAGTLIDIFALILTYSIFTNKYLNRVLQPSFKEGPYYYGQYSVETDEAFSHFMAYDYTHLTDLPPASSPIIALIKKYRETIYQTFIDRAIAEKVKQDRQNEYSHYSRNHSATGTYYGLSKYFEVLKISPTKDKELIKQAYRKMASIHHPDRSKSSDSEFIMKNVNIAYDALKQALDF